MIGIGNTECCNFTVKCRIVFGGFYSVRYFKIKQQTTRLDIRPFVQAIYSKLSVIMFSDGVDKQERLK